MRLIDADALLKLFVVTESGRRIPEVDIDNFPNTVSIKEIKDIIRHQPTAYDVDRVVKELEGLAKEHPYKVIGNPQTYSEYNEGWGDCADRAADIVERGGIE